MAHTISCLSKLKQIGVGWQSYADENDERIVLALNVAEPMGPGHPSYYPTICNSGWGRSFGHYLQDTTGAPFVHNNAQLTDKLWTCEANFANGVTRTYPQGMPGNYSANGQYGTWELDHSGGPRSLRVSELDQATERPILFDAIRVDAGPNARAYLGDNPAFYSHWKMNPNDSGRLNWPHLQKWNVTWLDLHATSEGYNGLSSGRFDHAKLSGFTKGKAYPTFTW